MTDLFTLIRTTIKADPTLAAVGEPWLAPMPAGTPLPRMYFVHVVGRTSHTFDDAFLERNLIHFGLQARTPEALAAYLDALVNLFDGKSFSEPGIGGLCVLKYIDAKAYKDSDGGEIYHGVVRVAFTQSQSL